MPRLQPGLLTGILWSLLAGLLALPLTAAADGDEMPPLSAHLLRLDANLTIAGELDLRALAATQPAASTIIDLRTVEEGTDDERLAVEALGMRYVNLPVEGAVIRDQDVARLRELLDATAGQPVILHCASGNRAAMLWGAVQLDAGRSVSEVLAAISAIATKPAVREAVRARASGGAPAKAESGLPQDAGRP